MQTSLLYLLLLIHLVVDFMQPAALVAWSKSSSWGLLVHSGIYTALNVVALAFTPLWWFWALVLGLSHLILDKAKVILNDKLPRWGLMIFVADQLIHIAIIFLVFFLGGLGYSKPLLSVLEVVHYPKTLLYLVVYIAVTFGGSILVFEVSNSMKTTVSTKKVISLKERYLGILERALAVTLILLGRVSLALPFLAPLAFVPSLLQGAKIWQTKGKRARFLLELTMSVFLALSAGIGLYFS